MKKLFAKHHLIQSIVGAVVMLILPAAHAQYWGNWTQDAATTLHSDYSSYGTVYLTVSASLSPSASVVTGTFPMSWGTIPAAGAFSGLNTLPGSNTFQVDIDLTHYNVSDGQSLFGFSDVASIGYGYAPITYSIKAFDSSGHWISTYDWTPIYNEANSQFPTDDAELTINSSTGVLDFANPRQAMIPRDTSFTSRRERPAFNWRRCPRRAVTGCDFTSVRPRFPSQALARCSVGAWRV